MTFTQGILDKKLKEAFFVIANQFSSYFQEVVYRAEGIRPKTIKVQSLDPTGRAGRNRKLHLIDVVFSSDLGFHRARLFIKVFESVDKVLSEANGALQLQEWLVGLTDIKTPRLLYYSKDYQILVYEGLFAEDLENSDLALEEKYFISGLALSRIHGSNLKEVDIQRYYLLVDQLINQLLAIQVPERTIIPFRDSIVEEIEKKLYYSYAGSRSFGDYHPGNIMVSKNAIRQRNTGRPSDFMEIHLIDPEFVERDDRIDRMEDVGNYFAKIALEDYVQTGGLAKTLSFVKLFFAGYNTVFDNKNITLEGLYPSGTTLELQIILSILFDLLFISRQENEMGSEWVLRARETRIEFINKLLARKPFSQK